MPPNEFTESRAFIFSAFSNAEEKPALDHRISQPFGDELRHAFDGALISYGQKQKRTWLSALH